MTHKKDSLHFFRATCLVKENKYVYTYLPPIPLIVQRVNTKLFDCLLLLYFVKQLKDMKIQCIILLSTEYLENLMCVHFKVLGINNCRTCLLKKRSSGYSIVLVQRA